MFTSNQQFSQLESAYDLLEERTIFRSVLQTKRTKFFLDPLNQTKVLYTKAAKRQENVGKLVSSRTFSTEILGVKLKSCRDMRLNLDHIVTDFRNH